MGILLGVKKMVAVTLAAASDITSELGRHCPSPFSPQNVRITSGKRPKFSQNLFRLSSGYITYIQGSYLRPFKPCDVIKGIEWLQYNIYLIWLSYPATLHHNSSSPAITSKMMMCQVAVPGHIILVLQNKKYSYLITLIIYPSLHGIAPFD
jgi:hypothetical protein